MPAHLSRLRRWFAGAIIAAVLVVAGVYFYARHRVQNALKQIPEKIGLEIKQSASGFSISKSDQGRTLFTIQASKAVQFRQGGHIELHDVQITLYGSDSSRFDRIRGSDFEYDQQSGDVTARGVVQIDLGANPEGLLKPDQSAPAELKNPIHLETSGLVFNQKSGDAYTRERIDFSLPQARGSAVGVRYSAKSNTFTMQSQVHVALGGTVNASIDATRAVVTKDPHLLTLDHPQLQSEDRSCTADQALFFLGPDNTLDHALARGNVLLQWDDPQPSELRSEQLDLMMTKQHDSLRSAVFSGDVRAQVTEDMHRRGSDSRASLKEPAMQGSAGRVVLEFSAGNTSRASGRNVLTRVHAEDNVKLLQHQNPGGASANAQSLTLTAPSVDFFLPQRNHPQRAETVNAQIAIRSSAGGGQQTLVTATKFEAGFDAAGRFTTVHGSPNARIVSQNPGQPDRISTSQVLDVTFQPGSGVQSVMQQGDVVYTDGSRQAWGDRARYTPGDQILLLTGSPRVTDAAMTATASLMRLNRATGEVFADGNVKTTYSDLKPQPNGAFLSSSSPIHVTAHSMSIHGISPTALYTGDARLWQDANIIEAPSIEFNRDRRSMVAGGGATSQTVSTVLVQTERVKDDQPGKSIPIAITSSLLSYVDSERKVHFEGDVVAKGGDLTIRAKQMDAFLQGRGASSGQVLSAVGRLDKLVARGKVNIIQPSREASGDLLTYAAADDKFVLTGGPPSIFDAEHGKITGVSLTFFRRDDRVLVEGNNSAPTVTQTRVAR